MVLEGPTILPPRSPAWVLSLRAVKTASLPAAWMMNWPRGAVGRRLGPVLVTLLGELGLPSTPVRLTTLFGLPPPRMLSAFWFQRLSPHAVELRNAAFEFQ